MRFYTVDVGYLKKLYDIDTEVDYREDYQTKPYIGIIHRLGDYDYFIPLTSAKERHKGFKNKTNFTYLIYEMLSKNDIILPNWVCVQSEQQTKHILALLDLRKMIPVPKKYYSLIDMDNLTDHDYRNLLIKELIFLKPLWATICKKAQNLYQRQKDTGIVSKMCCTFDKLEKVYDEEMK